MRNEIPQTSFRKASLPTNNIHIHQAEIVSPTAPHIVPVLMHLQEFHNRSRKKPDFVRPVDDSDPVLHMPMTSMQVLATAG